jgi:NTE family protein
MTFDNYGGTCGYQPPAWARSVADPGTRVRPTARSVQRYKEMQDFQNSKDRPYLHLVDGGVADNIGGRLILESLEQIGVSAEFREEVGFGAVRRIAVLVVNAHSSPRTEWDKSEDPPGMLSQLLQSASVPIDRYSFETIEAIKDRVQIYAWRRDLRIAQIRLAGATEAEAEAKANAIVPKVVLHAVSVSFDEIPEPQERAYFMELPTSFVLPPEAVDRLRDVAGRLMRQSPEYRTMVGELGGAVSDPGPADGGKDR